jgi:NADPH2:quinone reductase
MRAITMDAFGSYAEATIRDWPDPVPGPGEVLVETHAVAANYVDLVIMAGKYQFRAEPPFIPGKHPAGIIRAVGSGVGDLGVGDRVLAMHESAAFAECVVARADWTYRLPDCLSFAEAASMALVFDTAWFALHDRARLASGETVLVLGATGGVGLAAVQLARAAGATVLAGVSSDAKAALALDAGADAVIDLSGDDLRDRLKDQVMEATRGVGVDVVIDPLGGDFFDAVLRALAWRGRLVVIGFAAGRIPSVAANYLLVKNIEVSGLQVSDYRRRQPERMAAAFAEMFAMAEAGKIRPLPTTTVPFEAFRDAFRAIEERTARGRVVLQVHAG